jgi:hypothetical protein
MVTDDELLMKEENGGCMSMKGAANLCFRTLLAYGSLMMVLADR